MSSSAQEEAINSMFSSTEFAKSYLNQSYFPGITIMADNPSIPDSYDDTCQTLGRYYYGRLLTWLHNEFSSGRHTGKRVLNLCCGPTVVNTLSASTVFGEIIMSDINKPCLDEITNWVKGGPDAYDWTSFIEFVASLEDEQTTAEDVASRLRKAIKQTIQCNIRDEVPLGEEFIPVDCIIGVLALSSACSDCEDLKRNLKKTVSYLQPGGTILLVMILQSPGYYVVSGVRHPALVIPDVDFLLEVMSEAGLHEMVYEKYQCPDTSPTPNESYILISARKNQ